LFDMQIQLADNRDEHDYDIRISSGAPDLR
jgi:hypothetical protein